MALFGAQTPREIQALPPQSLELVVTDDDASAIAAVKALIPGTAAVDNFVVQFANGSTQRYVKWGAFTEAEHAFVRVFREPAAPRLRFEVRCDAGAALGPRCLGRFANGQLEAWLVYHGPLKAPFPPAAPWADSVAAKFAAFHAYRPPLHLLDVAKSQPGCWPRLVDLFAKARAPETARAVARRWDGAAALISGLDLESDELDRRLFTLRRRAPPGARVAFCHNDAAKRVLLRGDDLDAAFCGLERAGPNYAALDLAHYANADAAKPPGLDDRRAFLEAYLAALHGRRPALGDVSALLSDVCFFTVVDNYLRGFAALAAAASGPAHEAAGLVLEAQARLQHARAQQYVLVW